jgi:misacylated tRNA(Ala) deacylase
MSERAATELLYLRDAYAQSFDGIVVDIDPHGRRVALDRTMFYPTGGGQPHDTGTLGGLVVTEVRKDGGTVWHSVGDGPLPEVGQRIGGVIDWDRRHQLMRTHTVMHILCGVIWNQWGVSVTGGNMEPLSARMDFEFDPLPEGFTADIERLVNFEIAANRRISVSFLDQDAAKTDPDLIRTKVNLIPSNVTEIRIVDIVGLDKQADGGTHVATTGEVGGFRVVKAESKGKGNKRLRVKVTDHTNFSHQAI